LVDHAERIGPALTFAFVSAEVCQEKKKFKSGVAEPANPYPNFYQYILEDRAKIYHGVIRQLGDLAVSSHFNVVHAAINVSFVFM
jgi:hypothetical protein